MSSAVFTPYFKKIASHALSSSVINNHDSTPHRWFFAFTLLDSAVAFNVVAHYIKLELLSFLGFYHLSLYYMWAYNDIVQKKRSSLCSSSSAASLLLNNFILSLHVIVSRIAYRSVSHITSHSLPRQSILMIASAIIHIRMTFILSDI